MLDDLYRVEEPRLIIHVYESSRPLLLGKALEAQRDGYSTHRAQICILMNSFSPLGGLVPCCPTQTCPEELVRLLVAHKFSHSRMQSIDGLLPFLGLPHPAEWLPFKRLAFLVGKVSVADDDRIQKQMTSSDTIVRTSYGAERSCACNINVKATFGIPINQWMLPRSHCVRVETLFWLARWTIYMRPEPVLCAACCCHQPAKFDA
jgi:hypothetical protein